MDEDDFKPRVGRIRDQPLKRGRAYLCRIIVATARAGGLRRWPARHFDGSRIGRGAAMGRVLASRDRFSGLRSRRTVVKARLVRLGGKGMGAARAHLRYIQRDGVSRDGEGGVLYGRDEDLAEGKAFLERCDGDRHQFRFILSAEDGDQYADLRPLVRRFMGQLEADLGTRLDWVAADHLDTGHPHSHVMLRGMDEAGGNLVIAPEYIGHGMRARLAELVTLDLGPRSDREIQSRLRLEMQAERLTGVDRQLLRDRDDAGFVDARHRDPFRQALRAGRLKKLAALGLAHEVAGRWRLDEEMPERLRALGERGDIIRNMQRALRAEGIARLPAERVVHGSAGPAGSIVGRLVGRGLSDEVRDRHYLIVDGTDGRLHHIDAGRGDAVEPLPHGAIVRVTARAAKVRPADIRVAEIAALHGGRYSEEIHRRHDPGAAEDFVRAHVRRLEAIRRSAGGPDRDADFGWTIGNDHLRRAAAYEMSGARQRPLRVELLSSFRLDALVEASGATWLDRELVAERPEPLREAGFGGEVRGAKAARLQWLIGQGLAAEGEGGVRYRRDLLAALRQRELLELEGQLGMPSRLADNGERVAGLLHRRIDLASGRYGLVESAGELVLVPWRPDLERRLGLELIGKVGPAGLSWSPGRGRGPEIG
ncbi:MAG TPA: relaxase/mobilization nuclease RlxS [Allosphingosinicella sp.]|nr:relaxase/mobilization nuclease RlxS [Allosphingosinicella sp.]